VVEERTMEKWMALEMSRFHRGFVAQPRALPDLLLEAEPSATTRSGEVHRYDVATLRRIHEALSPLARRRLRLPVTFFVDKDMADDVHVADEPAIDALRALGELGAGMEPREGKLWMGHARARLVAQKYPGAFQFVYY
jgi:uncharacterized protein (UPF0216 family)